MKLNFTLSTMTVVLVLALPAAHAGDWTGNVSGFLGQKMLDDKDWPQHDDHGSIGVLFDIKNKNWPVSIALDVFASGDEDDHGSVKYEGYTAETHLGLRKICEIPGSSIKPYIGGGVAFVYAEETDKNGGVTHSQEDKGTGAWFGGGMYVGVTPHLNVGLDVRYSDAKVTLFSEDRQAGGLNAGVSVGYHW